MHYIGTLFLVDVFMFFLFICDSNHAMVLFKRMYCCVEMLSVPVSRDHAGLNFILKKVYLYRLEMKMHLHIKN